MNRGIVRGAPHRAPCVFSLLLLALLLSGCETLPAAPTPAPKPDTAALWSAINRNLNAQRPVQALAGIQMLAALGGWTPDLLALAGDQWLLLGDPAQALAYWEAVSVPDRVLRRKMVEAYLTLQRWTAAADALARLLGSDPSDGWAHYQLGLLRAPFDPQSAMPHLQSAVVFAPYAPLSAALLDVLTAYADDPFVSVRVGLVYMNFHQWALAEVAFRHAALLGDPFPEALAYVAVARDRQGKDGTAWMQRALALDPTSAQLNYLNGLHLRAKGDLSGSLQAITQASVLDPQNPAYLAELGTAYQLLNDLPLAEHWLTLAVLASGGAADFVRLLARFYADEAPALTDAGLAALERLVAEYPGDADVLASLGWARYQMGDRFNGAATLDAALRLAPDDPRALYLKGRVLLDTGEAADGLLLLERVAAGSGEWADAARLLLARLGG